MRTYNVVLLRPEEARRRADKAHEVRDTCAEGVGDCCLEAQAAGTV
jgi:hypothetical protein